MPCKDFHMPSQYLYKPCKGYVHCWENKNMPRLKNHLPCRARNHKGLCALRQDLHAPGMRARLNSLRPRLNRHPFADDIFKCIFLNENEWISRRISLKFFPKVRINNIPALVQIMACRRSGGKPLSEPMMVSLLTHICVTRPQWVNVEPCCSLALSHRFGPQHKYRSPVPTTTRVTGIVDGSYC